MRKQWALLNVVLLLLAAMASQGQTISPEGKKLARLLDSMDIEHLWLAGEYVRWRTGKTIEKPVNDDKPHTHCSAFVAAVGMKTSIYILRPPQHKASYLANAQYDWLQKEGRMEGWNPASSMTEAQRRANQGELVVAVYKENDSKKHGHIALVRPDEKSEDAVRKEGPQIIQAGLTNFNSATLKEGFRHHKGAWKYHLILFFSHKVAWDKVKTDTPEEKDAP